MKKKTTPFFARMMSFIFTGLLFVTAVNTASSCNSSTCTDNVTSITGLTVDALQRPLAIDCNTFDFAWQMKSDVIGIMQKSYRIIVATDANYKDIVWDSNNVESGLSAGIAYGNSGNAETLKPETDYYWKVTVTDNFGNTCSESSTFSTGLMNPSISAWDGARWIGSNELSLDASSAIIFRIQTSFQIEKGNKMSFIFGANDFRLNDSFQNVENVEGENYIRWELDISGVGKKEGAAINIYRVGYAKNDNPSTPCLTISKDTYNDTNLNELITPQNMREINELEIKVDASQIFVYINGKELIVRRYNRQPIKYATVTPLGKSGNDFNTYPNLNSIGFYAEKGEKVVFTDYRLMNGGHGKNVPLFDAVTGATYSIFNSIKGVTVKGNTITVDPDSDKSSNGKTFGYADPTYYGSLSMLRTEFETDSKKISKARLFVTAMGAYEMFINGKRVGEDWFNPGMSQYRETLTYHAYDITNLINKGKNAIGAILGPGFYTGYMTYTPNNYNFFGDTEALLAKIVVTFDDGTKKTIVTSPETWKLFRQGPIEYASMFQGQRYNADKEAAIKGWEMSGYNTSSWKTPEIVAPREWIKFDITARRDNPVRVIEKLTATRVLNTHSKDHKTFTYDMGIDMVGVPSVTLPAGSLKEGDVVMLRYGEEIYPGNDDSPNKVMPDGTTYESLYGTTGTYRPGVAGRILHDTYRAALATDFYIANKADETRDVVIEPHFTYRGYRYIQITMPSRKTPLEIAHVKGIVLSSAGVTGKYEGVTTDETGQLVNQLHKNIRRSQIGNFFSIPTDCPQRNERMGWTGDAQAYSRTATYNGDVQSFFRQWMVALRNDQGKGGDNGAPAGGIGSTVPTYLQERSRGFDDGSTWAAAVCMVPWQLYLQYGDLQIIKENFQTMKAWLDGMNYYKVPGFEGLSSKTSGLADWLSVDARTTSDICNNAIYLYMTQITAVMAEAIGETDYAATLLQRYNQGKTSFNKAYVDPATGMTRSISIDNGRIGKIIDSQTSYATPLNFDMFSDEMTITSGENAGMTYKQFAAKRLAAISAKPTLSGNDGKELVAMAGYTYGSDDQTPVNPTGKSLPYTITTGFSGTPNMLPALTANGQAETAYRMISCTDYASWLYPVKLGSTTVWERWNSYELAFRMNGDSQMNSFNHFALGAVGSWIYEYHLGITTESGQGYKDFILQPLPGGTYTSASGCYESNYGTIESSWTADKGKLTGYSFTVPANTTATIFLPVEKSAVDNFANIEGLNYIGIEKRNGIQTAKFKAVAGSFTMKMNNGRLVATTGKGF
jgi:Alpha-L-rhamnosidase N-terminal domain./Bacterial alpha-L-rhamnosidase.